VLPLKQESLEHRGKTSTDEPTPEKE